MLHARDTFKQTERRGRLFAPQKPFIILYALVSMIILYQLEPNLSVDEFVDILHSSSLAERRPVENLDVIAGMLLHADIILTARTETGVLVGISRAITDWSYCTYLSDLAVDESFQGRGIGRQLVRRTHEIAGLGTSLTLLAAPKAASYYPHIGMKQHHSCWRLEGRR